MLLLLLWVLATAATDSRCAALNSQSSLDDPSRADAELASETVAAAVAVWSALGDAAAAESAPAAATATHLTARELDRGKWEGKGLNFFFQSGMFFFACLLADKKGT